MCLLGEGCVSLRCTPGDRQAEFAGGDPACFAAGDVLSKQRRAGKGQGNVLVIGLGGGALPIYLHDVFSFNVECVDLDETVIRLAKTHFGFEESAEPPRLEVCCHAAAVWRHVM